MRSNRRQIGNLLGIPFYIDSSWFFIVALVTLANASEIIERRLVGDIAFWGWIAGLTMALLLFGSVLLHELGHSLMARLQGIKVNSITLFLFGGVAAIERESKTPMGAFGVAIAGPFVSVCLFLIFSFVTYIFADQQLIHYLAADLARINLILALFNLIPGLPLDGGQILKALVWQITGDRLTGIRWAATSGKFLGILGISFGIMMMLKSEQFQIGSLWIAFIGWFILRNATAYERLAKIQTRLRQIRASDAMSSDFRVVNAHLSVREFVENHLISADTANIAYFCASEGRYRGKINLSDVNGIDRREWEQKNLGNLAIPLQDIASVTEKTSLVQVIKLLEQLAEPYLTVLSLAGAVAGIIDRGDIVQAIAVKQGLPIPDSEIKRVKTEGTYPAYLPLLEIIKDLEEE